MGRPLQSGRMQTLDSVMWQHRYWHWIFMQIRPSTGLESALWISRVCPKVLGDNWSVRPGSTRVTHGKPIVHLRHLSALIWCDGGEGGAFRRSVTPPSSFPLIAASSRIPFRPHFFLLFGHRKQLGARTLSMVCRRQGLVSLLGFLH